VSMVVARKQETGEEKEVKLSAPALLVETQRQHVLQPAENPTPQQQALRKAWLGQ
jgi:hypothetical protein